MLAALARGGAWRRLAGPQLCQAQQLLASDIRGPSQAQSQVTPSSGGGARAYASGTTQRDPRYAQLRQADLDAFRGILGDSGVVTDDTTLQGFNRDWMDKYEGASQVALRPKTTQQVSQILAHCHQRRLAVVPQGGNTGLVGGSVPKFDEIVLSTANMNDITSFDPVTGVLVCQAGTVLEAADNHVREQGFMMPLDLGAKGSCHVGGNISTNAGGLRLLRYGSLHGTVLGLEAVLADGTVLDMLQTLRKDNTGYDLKQLFIGGEGTLGIVTAASILCPPLPSSTQVMYLACPSWDSMQQVFVAARKQLGEILSAFEFLDRASLDLTLHEFPDIRNPLPDAEEPFYLVVETSGSNEEHDGAKLEAFLEGAMGEGLVTDGTIAQDSSQAGAIWYLRENISTALKHAGPTYKYDVSLPLPEMYKMVEETRQRLSHLPVSVLGYGHVGDGNLHLNISAPEYTNELLDLIEPFVYEWVAARRGSVSAEHGLGQMKAECIGYTKSAAAVAMMGQLKGVFDPHHILNPYKLLPAEVLRGGQGVQAHHDAGELAAEQVV